MPVIEHKRLEKTLNKPLLLSTKTVAYLLNCSIEAVRQKRLKGTLPAKYFPGLGWRFKYSDIIKYVEEAGV